jgi:hypothetical protein
MNNEPVAWMGKDYDGIKTDFYFDVERNKLPYRLYETAIPLYTHPVKEPTDEEIVSLINKHIDYVSDGDGMKVVGVMDLCRARLRKASKK